MTTAAGNCRPLCSQISSCQVHPRCGAPSAIRRRKPSSGGAAPAADSKRQRRFARGPADQRTVSHGGHYTRARPDAALGSRASANAENVQRFSIETKLKRTSSQHAAAFIPRNATFEIIRVKTRGNEEVSLLLPAALDSLGAVCCYPWLSLNHSLLSHH